MAVYFVRCSFFIVASVQIDTIVRWGPAAEEWEIRTDGQHLLV